MSNPGRETSESFPANSLQGGGELPGFVDVSNYTKVRDEAR